MRLRLFALLLLIHAVPRPASAAFDLEFNFLATGSYTPEQLSILQDAADVAEAIWEQKITGYQPGIPQTGLTINVAPTNNGIAFGRVDTSTTGGGFRYTTAGTILVNPAQIDTFFSWPDNGLNFWDEIMLHEAAHVMGIGPHWVANGVYTNGTGQYTGAEGLAAYQREFDANATFIPVELRGGPGTPNVHWDQIMRSDPVEGDPSDPFALDPRLGITDAMGRDFGLELMTGALDPDFGEPFLSQTTVYAMRDLGFTTIPEPSAVALLASTALLAGFRRR